jgi:hypothetical protein
MAPTTRREREYQRVGLVREIHDESEEEKDEAVMYQDLAQRHLVRYRRWRALFFVALAFAFIFALTTAGLAVRTMRIKNALEAYLDAEQSKLTGFPTEFKDALGAIEYEDKVFTGDIMLNHTSREVYHDIPEGESRYFGDPAVHPEIDTNWSNMLKRMYYNRLES